MSLKASKKNKNGEKMVSRESIFEDTLGIIKRRRRIVKELEEARKAYRKFKRAKEHREAEMRIEIARMTSQETEETFGIAKMTDAKTKSVIKEDQKYTNKETGEDKKNEEIFELEQELIMIDMEFELISKAIDKL